MITRLAQGSEEECHVYYKTECETTFKEQEVEEEVSNCVLNGRCNNNLGDNCVEIEGKVIISIRYFVAYVPLSTMVNDFYFFNL